MARHVLFEGACGHQWPAEVETTLERLKALSAKGEHRRLCPVCKKKVSILDEKPHVRICEGEGCSTPLNSYNTDTMCGPCRIKRTDAQIAEARKEHAAEVRRAAKKKQKEEDEAERERQRKIDEARKVKELNNVNKPVPRRRRRSSRTAQVIRDHINQANEPNIDEPEPVVNNSPIGRRKYARPSDRLRAQANKRRQASSNGSSDGDVHVPDHHELVR